MGWWTLSWALTEDRGAVWPIVVSWGLFVVALLVAYLQRHQQPYERLRSFERWSVPAWSAAGGVLGAGAGGLILVFMSDRAEAVAWAIACVVLGAVFGGLQARDHNENLRAYLQARAEQKRS